MKNKSTDRQILYDKSNPLFVEYLNKTNSNRLTTFLYGSLMVSVAILVFSLILSKISVYKPFYFIMAFYFLFLIFINKYVLSKHAKYSHLFLYLITSPVIIGGTLMGTMFDPNTSALTIFVFMITLPLFIVDRPYRIISFITFHCLLFIVLAYIFKPTKIFNHDLFNMFVFYCIAIGTNYTYALDRLISVNNYVLVQEKSETDSLTSLYNRGTGEEKAKNAIESSNFGAFFVLDVDNFKTVNDTYGHKAGDTVLQHVANILTNLFSDNDIVYRLGGDEFAIFAFGLTNEDDCKTKCVSILDYSSKVHLASAPDYIIKLSIGCKIFRESTCQFEELYKQADSNLYHIKHKNKNNYKIS